MQRRVPGATGYAISEGENGGSYLVRTEQRTGLVWIARGASASAAVTEVAFNPVGCD